MKDYLEGFCEEFDYPQEARLALNDAFCRIYANPSTAEIFDGILKNYETARKISANEMLDGLNLTAKLTDVHEYTVKLLIHILLSRELLRLYAEAGLSRELWHAAMSDLKWKLIECRLVKGVWGTFVADCNWFSRWFDMTRFAFGRLQFEITKFNNEYEKNGLKLNKDSKVINVHIPRTGTPLDHGEVQSAYTAAAEFFKDEFESGHAVFVCSSWLLFPEHESILHDRSNIRKFMSDYDIFSSNFYPETNRSAIWRIFDCPEDTPIELLPETSFVMRAYKDYLKNGGRLGYGVGVFSI